MINKIDFAARNLTSNAGLFLLLENAKVNGIFELIDTDLVFDNESTNKIKMNHIKTMLCGHFIGIEKLELLKLLQVDPLISEFDITVKEPELELCGLHSAIRLKDIRIGKKDDNKQIWLELVKTPQ
ncbi:MAG TPA: hypothetical protein VF313_02175, partial [Anaerolineaceae bacterium]